MIVPYSPNQQRLLSVRCHIPFNWRHPMTIVPHLIRKVAKTFYNHALWLILIEDNWFVVETTSSKIHFVPYREWAKDQILEVTPVLSGSLIRGKIMEAIGAYSYDYASLLVLKPTEIALKRKLSDKLFLKSRRLYCYEFLAWAQNFPEYWRIEPEQYAQEMIKRGYEPQYKRISAKEHFNILYGIV